MVRRVVVLVQQVHEVAQHSGLVTVAEGGHAQMMAVVLLLQADHADADDLAELREDAALLP